MTDKKNREENSEAVGVRVRVKQKVSPGWWDAVLPVRLITGQVYLIFMVYCASWPLASLELKPSEDKRFLKKEEEAERP